MNMTPKKTTSPAYEAKLAEVTMRLKEELLRYFLCGGLNTKPGAPTPKRDAANWLTHAAFMHYKLTDPRRYVTLDDAKATPGDVQLLEKELEKATSQNNPLPGVYSDNLPLGALAALWHRRDEYVRMVKDEYSGRVLCIPVGEKTPESIRRASDSTFCPKARAEAFVEGVLKAEVERLFEQTANSNAKVLAEELGYPDAPLGPGGSIFSGGHAKLIIELKPDEPPDVAKAIVAVFKAADAAEAKADELKKQASDLRAVATALRGNPAKLTEFRDAVLESARKQAQKGKE